MNQKKAFKPALNLPPHKIKNQLQNPSSSPFNKTSLQQLDPLQQALQYSKKFITLNFNLQQKQLLELAQDISLLIKSDLDSLFFIVAYFLKACQLLQKNHLSPQSIIQIIQQKINILMNLTSVQTYQKLNYGNILSIYTSNDYFQEIFKFVQPIIYKKFTVSKGIDVNEQLENITMTMLELDKKIYRKFYDLIQTSTNTTRTGLQMGYKIERKNDEKAMSRIIQKLIRSHYNNNYALCSNSDVSAISQKPINQNRLSNFLSKIYSQMTQIYYTVKDILRAKCMFKKPQQIRDSLIMLIQQINKMKAAGQNVHLVQLQNRLHLITCDVLLVIQFGQLYVQLQLALQHDEQLYLISHKMYELIRSNMLTPIKLLFSESKRMGSIFFSKLGFNLLNQTKLLSNPKINTNQQQLIKQYQSLNQFFNLTSHLHKNNISKNQLEQQFSKEIQQNIIHSDLFNNLQI